MDTSFRDWAGLPAHILNSVVTMLDGFFDYLRFCGVCSHWRNTSHEANPDYMVMLKKFMASRKELPMLMFTTDGNNEKRSLFNISDRKTYEVKLPISYKYKFAGSSCGWLFCLDKTMVLNLVNPCNNSCIGLPILKDPRHLFKYEWHKKYFDYYIRKGILFSDDSVSPNGFGVLVIYGGVNELAFFKSDEPSWNFVNSDNRFIARDIIHYKGGLYAVNGISKLVEIDTACKTLKTVIPSSGSYANSPDALYLVESQNGELLMVKRFWIPRNDNNVEAEVDNDVEAEVDNIEEVGVFYEEDYNGENLSEASSDSEVDSSDIQAVYDLGAFPRSFEFKVFKMTQPLAEGSATWVEICNIGEQALFVGNNHSVSVSTVKFPECLSNSIYYTAQHHDGILPYVYQGVNEDSFIFNLEDKQFNKHHKLEDTQKYIQPPIWFVPNPQEISLGY